MYNHMISNNTVSFLSYYHNIIILLQYYHIYIIICVSLCRRILASRTTASTLECNGLKQLIQLQDMASSFNVATEGKPWKTRHCSRWLCRSTNLISTLPRCLRHQTSSSNYPYATHGAGICYLHNWVILFGQMLVNIPAPWSIWVMTFSW